MSVLAVRDLKVCSGSIALVEGVSLEVDYGVPLTLLGETGSGKSILLEAIMGTLPPDLTATGTVEVFGMASPAGDRKARRPLWGSQMALLPQEPWTALDPTMRCLPQVTEGNRQSNKLTATKLAAEALRRLGLEEVFKKFPRALSGGMAQRVAFAATRAGGANLMLADEPTKGLDAELRQNVLQALAQTVNEGGSLLVITHDVAVARSLGGRIAVMWKGQIVEEGPAQRVLEDPQHAYTRELIAADPSSWPARSHPPVGSSLLSASGISKSFNGQAVLRELQVEISEGERLAITGPSGSGKSTLGNILLGLIAPDSGSMQRHNAGPRWKFQKLYQDPVAAFAPRIKLRQSLQDLARIHGLHWSQIVESMTRLRLSDLLLDRLPEQVSGGELQRFAILRALLLRPHFLFADEPTSRLDPITQQQVMNVILESTAELGCALLTVTHDPAIASNVASRRISLGYQTQANIM